MVDKVWKQDLRSYFQNVRIIEKCKADTLESFDQFCEFIAEPAFEALGDELKEHDIRSGYVRRKGRAVHFLVRFPGLKADNFHYVIVLPKNSIELKLKLILKGRKNKRAPLEEKEEEFMPSLEPAGIMKLSKEALIRDIIAHYRDFNYEALTSSV